MKYELQSTEQFNKWLGGLKDRMTKQKVLAWLARAENGHFGGFKQIESNLFELRLLSLGFAPAGLPNSATRSGDCRQVAAQSPPSIL